MNDICKHDIWERAQEWEFKTWLKFPKNYDDWNSWWLNKFNGYEFLKDLNVKSVLEVGCGPFAKNIQNVLKVLSKGEKKIGLLDPLLNKYIENKYNLTSIIDKNTILYNTPLEEVNLEYTYDIVICINVLGHVCNANKCMDNIYSLLNNGGIIILGDDLTSQEDIDSNEDVRLDIGHPIKLDHFFFQGKLKTYSTVFEKILKREEGRNPPAHYGTLLYIGKK